MIIKLDLPNIDFSKTELGGEFSSPDLQFDLNGLVSSDVVDKHLEAFSHQIISVQENERAIKVREETKRLKIEEIEQKLKERRVMPQEISFWNGLIVFLTKFKLNALLN